jgi:anti-sigma regulatory factor (Ser/Thr protein kinase)
MRETSTAPPLAWSRVFPATAAQVREARQFLASALDGHPAVDEAILCLSELVANASVHSRSREPGGRVTVTAAIRGSELRVDVRDGGGPWTWPVRGPGGQRGRGLLIVGQLARQWGRTGDSVTGWTVWFTMSLATPPATTRPQPPAGEITMTDPGPAAQYGPQHPAEPGPAAPAEYGPQSPGVMASAEPGPAALAQYDTQGLRAMAADLTAHGLTTHLTDSRAGLDLTATLSPSGRREAELIIDEDGYAELRYWIPPGTPPAEVTAAALRALHAVTGPARAGG